MAPLRRVTGRRRITGGGSRARTPAVARAPSAPPCAVPAASMRPCVSYAAEAAWLQPEAQLIPLD
eukprot:gene19332-biopygen19037